MPKEMIQCADYGQEVTFSDGTTCEMDKDLIKVGWSKEAGHVEMAVCQTVDGVVVEYGFEDTLTPGTETDPEKLLRLGRLTPRYIQLDRQGLNRLIRVLRQARDDAFGADA